MKTTIVKLFTILTIFCILSACSCNEDINPSSNLPANVLRDSSTYFRGNLLGTNVLFIENNVRESWQNSSSLNMSYDNPYINVPSYINNYVGLYSSDNIVRYNIRRIYISFPSFIIPSTTNIGEVGKIYNYDALVGHLKVGNRHFQDGQTSKLLGWGKYEGMLFTYSVIENGKTITYSSVYGVQDKDSKVEIVAVQPSKENFSNGKQNLCLVVTIQLSCKLYDSNGVFVGRLEKAEMRARLPYIPVL